MESLNLIKNDPWLAPYKEAIEGRYQYVVNKEKNLTGNGRQTLSEMASGPHGQEPKLRHLLFIPGTGGSCLNG